MSWNEEDPRFQNTAFAPHLFGIIRQHQQTLEEIALLNLTISRAEKAGISRRYALIAMPRLLSEFQITMAPVMEYNLLRKLRLDDVAMAMVAGMTSATTSIGRSPRLSAALQKKRQEDERSSELRAKLREELLSAIAELPHVDGQIPTTPEGFAHFFAFKNKVIRELVTAPGASRQEVLAGDLSHQQDGTGEADFLSRVEGGENPWETVLAVENAQEYRNRFSRFVQSLSPQEKEMVAVIRQLEEEKGAGNFQDSEVAERMGIPTHNIPNLRKRMEKKLQRVA